MNKRILLPCLFAGASIFGLNRALAEVIITLNNGHVIRVEQVENIQVNQNGDQRFVVTYSDGTTESFAITDIESMTFSDETITDPVTPTPSDDPAVVTIEWNGNETPAVTCSAPGVNITTEGANVFVVNTNTDTEYTYVLRGQSDNGSLTLTADYKSTIQLDGLSLKSGLEEALNIKCGKRIALVVNDGTTNTLADATTDNGQKGALYCKGHLEMEGGGTLNLTGNVKHALSTKEYLQLKKKFTGTLNILAAASDGIHAGQYFQMNAGNVSIAGVKGDGIQAEATSTPEDEQNGQLIVKGGSVSITTTATDVAALKSDSLMAIEGGTFSLTTSGAGDKALKSKTNISITDGTFTIKQSGKPCIEAGDLGYVTAVKGVDVTVSGGTFDITTTGTAGRGFSAENLSISDAANVKIVNSAVSGTAADAVEVTAEPEPTPDPGEQETPKSYKVYVSVPTSGGGGGSSSAWRNVAIYTSDGTLLSNLTTTVTVNGRAFYYYDFKQSTTGTYYFGNPNGYTSGGGWGGGTVYTIKTSNISGPTDGKDHFYQASSQYTTSGTTRTYSLTDVTSQYEGGTIGGGTTTTGDVITAKALKVDKDLHLTGGTININMSGKGGKGIKVDGNAYVGDQTTSEGPILSIVTTGAAAGGGTTSGGGGGWPGGGPGGFGGEGGSGGTTKAFKVTGTYTQYGGNLYINTASAEGIESKTKSATSMNFNGGTVYLYCSDDCINSAGAINFNGAHVMAISYNNDAIDSNYGQNNSLVVTDGAVICFSTRGGAEMGFDCDANSRITFKGGTLVAGGGSQGGSSSSSLGTGSVHYKVWSANISYTANNYNTVTCGGKGIFT
ncbi:MAG: carbohydrate-binding domain-containing protein, partial [Bacteroidales bacterium]|nr:carbohydrate-binding domain-containing protein [Bacteroidales bacterium]